MNEEMKISGQRISFFQMKDNITTIDSAYFAYQKRNVDEFNQE